jgi:hypothetical protein
MKKRTRIENYEEAVAAVVVPLLAEMRKRDIGSVTVSRQGEGGYTFDLQPIRRRRAGQSGGGTDPQSPLPLEDGED